MYTSLILANKKSKSSRIKVVKRVDKSKIHTISENKSISDVGSLVTINSFTDNIDKPTILKKPKFRKSRCGDYNCGRWRPQEHQRFIEAILKFGNEWKQVQKYVSTRSSSQARSHAQKFFSKLKKTNILNFDEDFNNSSIKNLHILMNNLNGEELSNAVNTLNCVGFEKKLLRKRNRDSSNSLIELSTCNNSNINLM
jgi:SHAQKYF class myb-like DNA-binding protein